MTALHLIREGECSHGGRADAGGPLLVIEASHPGPEEMTARG